ncbi:Alcohol dehydrogenase [Minicystis rosea]|nr:Alcohol dehydrogenase [Minicystis rosea]
MADVRAWAAYGAKQPLAPLTYDPGPLGAEEVEVKVDRCGLCHSDLSVADNEWNNTKYPVVPGHEIVGRIVALGPQAKGLSVGQRVGIGWTASSCMHCPQCLSGNQHLCAQAVPTIIGHHGGFAETVRAHWAWAIPIPDALDDAAAAPLLCAGVTVFAPLSVFDIPPTSRIGVIGIGGLGHLAIKFAAAWGAEVTAMTSNPAKGQDAKTFGATNVVSSTDPESLRALQGSLDLIIVTANAPSIGTPSSAPSHREVACTSLVWSRIPSPSRP